MPNATMRSSLHTSSKEVKVIEVDVDVTSFTTRVVLVNPKGGVHNG